MESIGAVKDDFQRNGFSSALRNRWRWLLALGIIQILGGMAAIAIPHVGSLIAVALIAAVLIVSALFHLVHAFQVRKWPGFLWHLLGGLLYGAAGALIVLYPIDGIVALMLVLGVLFIADGAIRAVLATVLRPADGWLWFLAGGLSGILLGTLLLLTWPVAAVWVVGTLFGINLLLTGVINGAIAWMCRKDKSLSASRSEPATA